MKCVCGHDSELDKPRSPKQALQDIYSETFIRIKGSLIKERAGESNVTVNPTLWACPKCGTLKIDV